MAKEKAVAKSDAGTVIRKGTNLELDTTVGKIKALWEESISHVESAILCRVNIGRLIIKEFYDNDIRKAQSKNPTKQSSFSDMLKHEDMPAKCKSPMSISNLIYSAAVYDGLVERKFPLEKYIKAKQLSYTHLVILTRLKKEIEEVKGEGENKTVHKYHVLDFPRIEEFANKTVENKWSTDDLQGVVTSLNSKGIPEFDEDENWQPLDFDDLPEFNGKLLNPLDGNFKTDWDRIFVNKEQVAPKRVARMKEQIEGVIDNYETAIRDLRIALKRLKWQMDEFKTEQIKPPAPPKEDEKKKEEKSELYGER